MNSFIKKTACLLLTSVLTMGIITFAGQNNTVYASEGENNKKSISVNGTYSIKVTPDIAYIDIAVKTFDADAIKAQEDNKDKMNKVIEELKKLEIEDTNIRTIDYVIQPRYEWKNVIENKSEKGSETRSVQTLLGYDVINNIKVTVTDLQKVGNVIDVTVQEGVNEANNISFGLSEKTKTEKYLQALKGAVENAKSKAEVIASVYGITLSLPSSISESGTYFPSPVSINKTFGISSVSMSDSKAATPISSGEMEITSNVNVVYEY